MKKRIIQQRLALSYDKAKKLPYERLLFRQEKSENLDTDRPLLYDSEQQIVDHILQLFHTSGFRVNPQSIINLYVGLKSKPLTLLVGPGTTGKIASVQNLAKGLIGNDPLRFQMMVGHAWWANQCADIIKFTEAQTRWNSSKILELIQEANQPENAQRIYIACLTRISPAELNEFFSEVAFQLHHDQVMRVASIHLTEPIPFPSNMFLIGTIDESHLKWVDADLLSKTSLIHWTLDDAICIDRSIEGEPFIDREKTFLRSCIRNAQGAFQKLYRILKSQRQAFSPLFQTGMVLQKHKIRLPNSIFHSAMVYVANSWSLRGKGLYSQDIPINLDKALDYAITQTLLLPIEDKLMDSNVLRKKLLSVFRDRFPHSSDLVRYMG